MYSTTPALVLAFFWILNFALLVDAGIYVLKPSARSTCHGGQNCTIDWLDDGSRPLVSAIGLCTFGLYTGKQKLVQAIPAVDVSITHSVTFMPNPAAGPNSDAYYIGITSTVLKDNSSTPYTAYSPWFSIDQMTGSFESPLPEATSKPPLPSTISLSTSGSTTVLSTITVGTLSTSLPPIGDPTPTSTKPVSTSKSTSTSKSSSPSKAPTASPSPTRLTTSIRPSSLSSPTGTSTVSPTSTSTGPATGTGNITPAPSPLTNGAVSRVLPCPALALLLLAPLLLSFL
ncbi:hypothetical protein Hypma_012406 [Hypsizygus marmoreus]|uniref:Yeast cell wall synthesis Kre9/Knh1-like N-terminal domain-containing protein n=1 Tax=Hypsizygus marmoreus TaxID=39966 RepID=A0A369JIW1_HYPMA|nr:hypothetical protein Hypma_012406 [Hypsizygus marmoreus]